MSSFTSSSESRRSKTQQHTKALLSGEKTLTDDDDKTD